MRLTSSVFADGAMIPGRFTCDDQDPSPPLAGADAPNNVRSFVLLCDAPGGTWRDWGVSDILPVVPSLPFATSPRRRFCGAYLAFSYG